MRLSAQVGYRASGRDSFVGRPVPSTGLRAWTLTPGVRLRLGPGVSAYVYVKTPVATSVNDAQLRPRVDILAGLSRSF